jgi:4-amino-4-deoxy-L-arabinose transferase-like glycosyltransferase
MSLLSPSTFPGLTKPDDFRREDFLALVVIFALGLGLRLIRLFDLDLIFDEAVLLLQIRESYSGIWNLCKTDNFPPLYSWMIKVWMSLGSGYAWFRLFGALGAALTAPVAYLLAREVSGRKLAWSLGLMCAISPTLIYYSQFVRMYNIQALFVCLSLLWFVKALKSGSWRHWLLLALANLVGFYLYVFMSFVFLGEALVLIYFFRLEFKKYIRPVLSQLPFASGALVWLLPTLQRYAHVQQAFWTQPLTPFWFMYTGIHLGLGVNFHHHYWVAVICLIPLLLGLVFWTGLKPRNREIDLLAFVALFATVIIFVISLGGRSFFHDRYLVYVYPLYLAVILYGWQSLHSKLWRWRGIISIAIVYLGGLGYYYADYYYTHIYVGFIREPGYTQPGEGHGLSRVAAEVAQRLRPGEVIVHYGAGTNNICSYFASLVYHDRALPEYIYSPTEIEQHNGQQYLKPGDWIKSLADLKKPPIGVWIVTMDPPHDITSLMPPRWVRLGNFPEELVKAGYEQVDMIAHNKISALHYVRHEGRAAQ